MQLPLSQSSPILPNRYLISFHLFCSVYSIVRLSSYHLEPPPRIKLASWTRTLYQLSYRDQTSLYLNFHHQKAMVPGCGKFRSLKKPPEIKPDSYYLQKRIFLLLLLLLLPPKGVKSESLVPWMRKEQNLRALQFLLDRFYESITEFVICRHT